MNNNYLKECQKYMKKLRHISMARFWKNYIYRDTSVCDKTPYHGLLINKMPCDMFIYSDIFYHNKPDTLVEIGTGRGGSAVWFSDMFDGQVITVDINCPEQNILDTYRDKNIVFIYGDATTQDVYEQVSQLAFGNVFVVDDGSHLIGDIIDCFKLYNQLVVPGGFYIIEDGMSAMLFKDRPRQHPCYAIDRILHDDGYDFELFTWYDKFVFTSLLRGILRRNKYGNNK